MAETRNKITTDKFQPIAYGTSHMVGSNYFEPQRTNNFELQIVGLGSNGQSSLDHHNVPAIPKVEADPSKAITLSVDSYSAPQININVIPVAYGNNKIKYAGTPEFPDSSVTINDYIGLDVERIISEWQSQVYNPATAQIGYASSYKKTAYLLEYSPNGQQLRSWVLYGCWPSQLNLGEFSQDGNAVRKIQMTITYDYAVPLDANGNPGYGPGIKQDKDGPNYTSDPGK